MSSPEGNGSPSQLPLEIFTQYVQTLHSDWQEPGADKNEIEAELNRLCTANPDTEAEYREVQRKAEEQRVANAYDSIFWANGDDSGTIG